MEERDYFQAQHDYWQLISVAAEGLAQEQARNRTRYYGYLLLRLAREDEESTD